MTVTSIGPEPDEAGLRPDEAVLPDTGHPGDVRIIATVLLGCALYLALATVVGVLGLGTIGMLVALVIADLISCRITGLRGRWTHVLIGATVLLGTATIAVALVTLVP